MNIINFKKGLVVMLITLCSIFLSSCEPIPAGGLSSGQKPYMAKLVNVNWNNQSATQNQLTGVQVIRNNQRIPTRYRMYIQPGDRIITNSSTSVSLVYREGSKVMINTNTEVLLRNPTFKIFISKIGEVFLDVKSRFEVIDEFGSVVNDGTQYLVSKRNSRLKVAVLDGRVSLNSSLQPKPTWSGMLLTKGKKVTRRNSRKISKVRRVSKKDYDYIKRWTEPLKRNFPNDPPRKEDSSVDPIPGVVVDLIRIIRDSKNNNDRDTGSTRPQDDPGSKDPDDNTDYPKAVIPGYKIPQPTVPKVYKVVPPEPTIQ